MATVKINMPDDFINKLAKLAESTDMVVEKALEAGGEVVLQRVKSNLAGVIGNTKQPSKSTGELLSSLGVSPMKVDNGGVSNVKVGFNEPRRVQSAAKGKRSYKTQTNAMIANVLEYGRHNQPPRPFLGPARSSARGPCIEAMKAKLEEVVNSL